MAQHDMNIANQGFPATRADLNNALQAIATNNSGTSAPSTTFANQWFYNTSSNKLFIRNEANNAFIEVATLDQTNNEWQITTGVIQAKDSDGLALKTDDGTTRLFIKDSDGSIGLGTTSPTSAVHVLASPATTSGALITARNADATSSNTSFGGIFFNSSPGVDFAIGKSNVNTTTSLSFRNGSGSSLMELDSSGNLIIGDSTASFNDTAKTVIRPSSDNWAIKPAVAYSFNRTGGDGDILEFYRGSSTKVGTIGSDSSSSLDITSTRTELVFKVSSCTQFIGTGVGLSPFVSDDDELDLGRHNSRYDDIFATNGTIATSDENEKQNIASLTSAEITAATAISKLFKTFKWKSKVAAKGDDARTHTGIVAQQVQTAMSDAGLEASKYAFWCSNTWWQKDVEVAAVEAVEAKDAVYDDDGKLVSEAVKAEEARDAYTRTDTYDTIEEAPEGATEHTRMGVRYPELLAFVGAATEQRLTSIEARLTALEG
mgnify:CR=1 FL=1